MQEMQETPVWSLGWEDPLEEARATHTSIFAWEISWIEEPGGLQSMGLQRVGQDCVTEHVCTAKDIYIFYIFLIDCKGKKRKEEYSWPVKLYEI